MKSKLSPVSPNSLRGLLPGLGVLVLILFILLAGELASPVLAQGYSFQITEGTVDVFWNTDGTASVDIYYTFQNDPSAGPIEFVDVGLPRGFDEGSIQADVNGQPVDYISRSEYQGSGQGVAVALGDRSIPPGASGEVHVWVPVIEGIMFPDDQDPNYVSGVYSPPYFDSGVIHGNTNLTVAFHLPETVQPEEGRWHSAPGGFPEEPETALDENNRVLYIWRSSSASLARQYAFGASFPRGEIPEGAIAVPGQVPEQPGGQTGGEISDSAAGALAICIPFGIIGGIFLLIFGIGFVSDRQRKLAYMPPKIAIEGHGIKRGLTSIEAAILMEEPMDKILTMILFAVIKKGAAAVRTKDPLALDFATPQPADLHEYEKQFLAAFETSDKNQRRRDLQKMMVNLVQNVSQKMKGFSRKETVDYYRDIIQRAWAQVEAADTPEVKSQKYDEVMEWTMLDRRYEDRTRDVFQGGPVFVPVWWPRYDPTFGGGGVRPSTSGGGTPSAPSTSSGGGGVNMPTLPGSAFAGSIITGVQDFARGAVGNISDFTGGVTKTTNPPPPPPPRSSRGGSGRSGGGCACACACAGCACACAGGGR